VNFWTLLGEIIQHNGQPAADTMSLGQVVGILATALVSLAGALVLMAKVRNGRHEKETVAPTAPPVAPVPVAGRMSNLTDGEADALYGVDGRTKQMAAVILAKDQNQTPMIYSHSLQTSAAIAKLTALQEAQTEHMGKMVDHMAVANTHMVETSRHMEASSKHMKRTDELLGFYLRKDGDREADQDNTHPGVDHN
jgi:hypothetical protein